MVNRVHLRNARLRKRLALDLAWNLRQEPLNVGDRPFDLSVAKIIRIGGSPSQNGMQGDEQFACRIDQGASRGLQAVGAWKRLLSICRVSFELRSGSTRSIARAKSLTKGRNKVAPSATKSV